MPLLGFLILEHTLKQTKGSYDNFSNTNRIIFSKGVIEQLRETWEQVIADFIHPVIRRFDNSVRVSSIGELLDLTEEDVVIIMNARSRLSEEVHFASEVLNSETVTYEELYKETKVISSWIESMNERKKTSRH